MRKIETQTRKEICEIGRRLWKRGFCAGNEGNLSVRLGADRVLCTPTGVSKGFMRPEMMVVVNMAVKQVGGGGPYRPTSEIGLHLAIYEKRADVKAVIHSHTPCATAFACSARANRAGELPMGIHPEAEVFLRRVPVVGYCTPGTSAVGEKCCEEMGPRTNSMLLGNHGVVCFGAALVEAWTNLEMVEAYCRFAGDAEATVGGPRKLTAAELQAPGAGIVDGPRKGWLVWATFLRMHPREDVYAREGRVGCGGDACYGARKSGLGSRNSGR